MLVLAALAYITMLFGAMFGLALGTSRPSRKPDRLAETGGFEPPRELNTP